jgi:serine/threonine protein kinase/tetratricopeptide (TPR) repeat protein
MGEPPGPTRPQEGTVTIPDPALPSAVLRIGPYKVLRTLGHGGMGTVYLAARADDQYQKRVAIKVIRGGALSEDTVRHFRRERQILASLDHPNVGKLLDGGTTDEGLPYIVMDYIEGQPIDRYCDGNRVATAERLTLFRSVCAAVQYAHRNLVVHRDIKPSNVLVTMEGVPKLLDFGVAKLLNPEISGEALTATGLAMTPEYASPEQARGEPITTASDVYSLGVLLYELLTGRRPYRLKSRQAVDVLRAVCEEEPERPSTAVGRTERLPDTAAPPSTSVTPEAVSQARSATPEKLQRRLRGDLDNIVMMALRKEPQRRYPSVEALSEDIRRHLEGLPVTARTSTFAYRTAKFTRRNAGPVAAIAAIVILILSFGTTTILQSKRVVLERDQAAKERDKAQKIADFMVDLFRVSEPNRAKGATVTAREILDRGAAKIATGLKDQPETRASLLHTIGSVYTALGMYDEARSAVEEALQSRRRMFNGDNGDVARSLSLLATVRRRQGDIEGAETLDREALAIRRRLFGEDHPDVADSLNDLALILSEKGEVQEAEQLNRQALAIRRRSFGSDHPRVLDSLNNLAIDLARKGNSAEAEGMFREVLEARRRRSGNETTGVAYALENLAHALSMQGKYTAAEPLYREALGLKRRLLGDRNDEVAEALSGLAALLLATHRPEEAERLLREALDIQRSLPPTHPDTAVAQSLLGASLSDQHRCAEADPLLRGGYAVLRAKLGDRSEEAREAGQRIVHFQEVCGKPEKTAASRTP